MSLASNEEYAPFELKPELLRELVRVEYDAASPFAGRVFRLPGWTHWSMERRIAFMRLFGEHTARDPAIALKATRILRDAGVSIRDYRAAWSALLLWVQQNIRFTGEQRERLQSPQATLTLKMGDCDDMALLLFALGASIRLDSRFVLSGAGPKGRARWIEGVGACPTDVNWTHVFLLVGWPPFAPTQWEFAEPTLDVRLGWDSMKEPIPRGRADMGDAAETLPVRATRAVKALPWTTIAGTVIGSVISFIVTRQIARALERRRR